MSVFGIAMVRDEADIIGRSVGWMLKQTDHVIVADNGSTDGTREILEGLDVELLDDLEPAYYQSRKMSELADWARRQGAEWVVPFDADEMWRSPEGRLADVLMGLPENFMVAEAALYDHVATGADDPGIVDPVLRLCYRRDPCLPLPKVAVRALEGLVIHQGNHGATFPNCDLPLIVKHLIGIRHFPYRSLEQFIRKVRNGAAAYAAATDLPEDYGGHWRQWGRILDERGEEGLAEIFQTWYWREDPSAELRIEGEFLPALTYDPCPLS